MGMNDHIKTGCDSLLQRVKPQTKEDRTFFKRRKSNNYEAFPTNVIARISDGMALEGCFSFYLGGRVVFCKLIYKVGEKEN